MAELPGYFIKGEGVPVLLLHCSMSTKEQWINLSKILSNDFKVIAIDLYGYGQTAFPEKTKGFSLDDEIELIEKILESNLEKNEKFHLVGHSYGGAVAMKYSTLQSKRNLSLCVFEPMLNHVSREIDPDTYILAKEFISEIENDISSGNPETGSAKFIDFFSGEGTFQRLPKEIKQIFTTCIKKMPLDYKATINENLHSDIYKNIDLPVCLISGKHSPSLTVDISNFIPKIIPDIKHHKVTGGHMSPIEKSAEVNKIIVDFIKSFH